ncbi:hypothetical protein DPMN_015741 [Dreissena polymorpha]|uniref:EGF-like domain-containing protein n=1 Tax=Dreissena polymorpha TaxID=45954 RepID=A0A9D4NBK6_DREPO|nr:hypothetical protein DPMN_015741 [Dreissena polymorpha]
MNIFPIPAVCKHACLNGGTCTATDKCECPERFKGSYCAIFNLKKQSYDNGETIRITDRNYDREYLPSSGDTTLSCKNGHWCDKDSCVPATDYKIRVVTADKHGAGTDGNVTIRMKGTHRETGIRELSGWFERKSIDDINKFLPDDGNILAITIGVTRLNMFNDGWIPSNVTVHDVKRNQFYLFEHDETELDNKSITLARRACITVERGYLTGERGPTYKYKHDMNTIFGCMMFCLENNCVQAEYWRGDR